MAKSVGAPTTYKPYVVIWAWLIALLLAGVAVAETKLSKGAIVAVVLALSTVKAVLVAMHYMHLKTDRHLLAFVLLAPFLLVGLALCVFFSSRLVVL